MGALLTREHIEGTREAHILDIRHSTAIPVGLRLAGSGPVTDTDMRYSTSLVFATSMNALPQRRRGEGVGEGAMPVGHAAGCWHMRQGLWRSTCIRVRLAAHVRPRCQYLPRTALAQIL